MANIFGTKTPAPPSSAIPSSSPAFGTPVHPLKPFKVSAPAKHAILPIILPPATLRPLAFRTFTKKHGLTLTSSALQELATFIGRHCGSGWREEGLAEKVLEEVAKSWKNCNGGVIVEGASPVLKDILKTLEGNMSGGKIVTGARGLSRQNSLLLEPGQEAELSNTRLGLRPVPSALSREDSQQSLGVSGLGVEEEDDDDDHVKDARKWLRVIDAYKQPRFCYNVAKKHFERWERDQNCVEKPANRYGLLERHQNHLFCPRHHTRPHCFGTDTTSYTRGYSEMSLSTSLPSQALEPPHSSVPYRISKITRLPLSPTCLDVMAATTCSWA